MLAELRAKSQITIPKEIVETLGLSQGDKFEVYEHDGVICLMPVVVYPKKYLDSLKKEINKTKIDIDSGKSVGYDDINKLFEDLEK